MTATPELGERLPAGEAPGDGMALIRHDALVGLPMEADEYKRRREALLRFVHHQLTPADVDPETGKLLKVNDYYTVPGSTQKALTKKGAELLGELYKYKTLRSVITESEFTVDYGFARADVTLHRSGIVVGAASASACSLEKTFQGASRKYQVGSKVDWRASRNDIEARAQKRGYVRAMIAACAASDIFTVADEYEGEDEPKSKGGIAALLELTKHPAFTDAQRGKVKEWLKTATGEQIEEQVQRAEEKIAVWKEAHATTGPLD